MRPRTTCLLAIVVLLVVAPTAVARVSGSEARFLAKRAIKHLAAKNAAEEDGELLRHGVKSCARATATFLRCTGFAEFYDPYEDYDLRCRYRVKVRETPDGGISTYTRQDGCHPA